MRTRDGEAGIYQKDLYLILGIILSLPIMVYFSDNLAMTIVGFLVFVSIPVIVADFDLIHPFVWFMPIYAIYTVAAPLVVFLGYLPYRDAYITEVQYHYLGAIVFALVVGSRRYPMRLKRLPFNRKSLGVKAMMLVSLSICFVYIYNFAFLFSSKFDRVLSQGLMGRLGFGFYMLITSVSIVMIQRLLSGDKVMSFKGKEKWPSMLVLACLVFFTFSFLITGERHVFFKLILVVILIYHSLYKRISKTSLVVLFCLGLLVSSVGNQYKTDLVTGQWGFDMDRMMKDILYSEFKTVGRNLAILVENVPEYYPFTYGKSMLSDIARASLPGFMFPRFESTSRWFNATFFPNFFRKGGGVGFTLIGACYINFGLPGIVVIFGLIAYGIKRLYMKATRSSLAFIVYVNTVPIMAFSLRGDFYSVLSSMWKHVLLVIVVALIIDRLGMRQSAVSHQARSD